METSAVYAYRAQATMKDYPGRSCALFFTPGCNFRCGFCHNSSLFSVEGKYTWVKLGDILVKFRKQWINAATITGGEPTIHEELPETIKFFKRKGFLVKLDTNGSNPDMLETCLPLVDYVAMDIKCAFSRYQEITGYGNVDNLKRSVKMIMEQAKDYEFRTTVIEMYHDDADLVECAKSILGAKRYVLQPFVPHEELPLEELRTKPRTRPSFLHHAAEVIAPYVPNVSIRGE